MEDDSILTTTKKLLGIAEEYTQFDRDIIIDINTVFNILAQLGVGPKDGFTISDATTVWSDFISETKLIEMVRTYMGLKVRMLFDPPTTSAVAEATNSAINELEWRLNASVDPEDTFD